MANLRKLVLFLFGVHFLRTHAADKYTDENRPYEFGFTIEGEQHRHEKKDENGIIMGEFGFITADGVYHVTVYATDENGNFKILSMKNIRVKPYPTSPEAGIKKGKSSTFTAPQKDSISESTNEEKTIKQQVASPAKSCSHCRLPTTTTTASPIISKVSAKLTNSSSTKNFHHNQNNNNFSNKNPISLQNSGEQQKDYNSETHQFNPQTVADKFSQEEQSINKFSNKNPISLQNAGEQEKDYSSNILQSNPQTVADKFPQKEQSNNKFSNKNPISLQNSGEQQKDYNSETHQSNPQTVADKFPQEEQSNNKFSNKNPISLQNSGEQQKDYNSETHQSNPQAVVEKYPQEEQIKNNSHNGNLLTSQNLGYQVPNFEPIIPQSYPQTNTNNQSYLQQGIVSHNPVQAVNPVREQYITPQNIPLSVDQRMSVPDMIQNNPGESNVGSIEPQPNRDPISRSLQVPINEDYKSKQVLPENKQSNSEVKSFNQNELNNNNDKSESQSYPQELNQLNHGQGSNINEPNQLTISSIPSIISRQAVEPQSKGAKSVSGNPKGERSPKSFGDFIEQSVSPEELASTGPNLYRPSLPNESEFSGKPVLLAAQMQKVDKNTNIYNKNPGESDGLPEGITIDDVTNLLYTFNYSVGFHGHHEKGYSNGAKQGYYYVTGRNGVRTRVDYVADEKGFRPKITQEILDIVSDEVPKPESEKDEKYGLKGYEFKWLYFPLDLKPI